MNRFVTGLALATLMGAGASAAQAPASSSVDELVSRAKAAAGVDWTGTFSRLCIPPPPAGARAGGARAGGPAAGPPARATWYAEPAKVADNLYFLGTKAHHSWALVGSDGIIVFEALFEYASADQIEEGFRKLGLDGSKVKFIVLSHAHGDHDGGARFIQDIFKNARMVYGAPDWDAVEKSTNRPGGKPRRDLDGTDGMKMTIGDTSVQIVTMPGHTAGTLSYLFEIKDRGRPLKVAYVGGTAIPFDGDAAYYDQYISSTQKMARAAADFGATVLLSNHTEFDNGYYKAHTAANRKGADVSNPFDMGAAGVARYFSVVENCTAAAKLRSGKR
ncbi:MAG: MBL fold metallo-hydrolase [Vicinamibacterales bacterium]